MLYSEDNHIVLGGVTLPGLIKKFEIRPSAKIEEVEVEGSSSKPKQAIGYEDAKITIELILDDTQSQAVEQAIAQVYKLFRKNKAQTKPLPIPIVSEETSLLGIDKVLVKEIPLVRSNKTNQYTMTLELWEYIPATITAKKSGSGSTSKAPAPAVSPGYQSYLKSSRGTSATAKTPAVERHPSPTWVKNHLNRM